MINDLLQKEDYKQLTAKQVKELVIYLKNNNIEFNLTANLIAVNFNPKLPEKMYSSMSAFTLFSLANYTFSSLNIKQNTLEFETGFGSENFASVCTINFNAIFQIGVNESILYINPSATVQDNFKNKNLKEENEQKKRSMNAFKLK